MRNQLLESLARAEHNQWCDWASRLLAQEKGISQERKDRWERLIKTPYEQLTDEEKESDRTQAMNAFFVADRYSYDLLRNYGSGVFAKKIGAWLTTSVTGTVVMLIGLLQNLETIESFALFFVGLTIIIYGYVNVGLDYYIDLWETKRIREDE